MMEEKSKILKETSSLDVISPPSPPS